MNKINNSAISFCYELWDFSLLKNLNITLYTICIVLFCFGFNTFLQHLPSRAVAHGVNNDSAALLTSIFSIGTVTMHLPTAALSQWKRTNVILLFAVSVTLGGIFIVLMGFQVQYPNMVAFTILSGFCNGICSTTWFMIPIEIAGEDKLARVQGIAIFLQALVSLFITPFGGWLYDYTGNYDLPFFVMGSFQLLGGLIFLPVSFRKINIPTKTNHPGNKLEIADTKDEKSTELQQLEIT